MLIRVENAWGEPLFEGDADPSLEEDYTPEGRVLVIVLKEPEPPAERSRESVC